MALSDYFATIENLAAMDAFRESLFAYPVVEGIHLLGLSLAVGLLALADLRLAGWIMKKQPTHEVLDAFRPWFATGFVLVMISGVVLFMAKATEYAASPLFWVKMLLIALAGANALYFEITLRRAPRDTAEISAGSPVSSLALVSPKTAALISLTFWVTIVVLGRLLAYFQSNA
jgi:hypothetical protein